MSKQWEGFKTPCFEIFKGGREYRSDHFKKLTVLAQILSFLQQNTCNEDLGGSSKYMYICIAEHDD